MLNHSLIFSLRTWSCLLSQYLMTISWTLGRNLGSLLTSPLSAPPKPSSLSWSTVDFCLLNLLCSLYKKDTFKKKQKQTNHTFTYLYNHLIKVWSTTGLHASMWVRNKWITGPKVCWAWEEDHCTALPIQNLSPAGPGPPFWISFTNSTTA